MGCDAWSCDFEPCDGDPAFHIQGDVLPLLTEGWDLLIAHPPCTYLTVAGLHWNTRGVMVDGRPRSELTEEGLDFVRALMAAPIQRKCVENPVSCISSRIRKPDQIIQPYEFGADASKKTCLWLENLPPLPIDPALRFPGRMVEWRGKVVERWANQTDSGQNRLGPSPDRWKERSRTYSGIAQAFARTWAPLVLGVL